MSKACRVCGCRRLVVRVSKACSEGVKGLYSLPSIVSASIQSIRDNVRYFSLANQPFVSKTSHRYYPFVLQSAILGVPVARTTSRVDCSEGIEGL